MAKKNKHMWLCILKQFQTSLCLTTTGKYFNHILLTQPSVSIIHLDIYVKWRKKTSMLYEFRTQYRERHGHEMHVLAMSVPVKSRLDSSTRAVFPNSSNIMHAAVDSPNYRPLKRTNQWICRVPQLMHVQLNRIHQSVCEFCYRAHG